MVMYAEPMFTPNQEVARNIAAAITQKDRTKKSVADSAGIPITTFNRKLKAQAEITIMDICLIADALGVNPASLAPTSFHTPAAAA